MLKRGHVGIYHRFSQEHLDRYVKEYAGRRNVRELDTIDQMSQPAMRFSGVRLSWADLVQSRPIGTDEFILSNKQMSLF